MIPALILAQLVAWQWAGDPPGSGQSFYRAPRTVVDGPVGCSFVYDGKAYRAHVACTSNGRELWRRDEARAFVADAALAIDGQTLYVARFSDISTGCVLHAYELSSGHERWSVSLNGIGPIAHSEYLNAVQLRVVAHQPVVFGWESGGKYIESRDPVTGALGQSTRVP